MINTFGSIKYINKGRRVSFNKEQNQSASLNDREFHRAGSDLHNSRKVGKLTCQPCRLIPICQNQSQKVYTAVLQWVSTGMLISWTSYVLQTAAHPTERDACRTASLVLLFGKVNVIKIPCSNRQYKNTFQYANTHWHYASCHQHQYSPKCPSSTDRNSKEWHIRLIERPIPSCKCSRQYHLSKRRNKKQPPEYTKYIKCMKVVNVLLFLVAL